MSLPVPSLGEKQFAELFEEVRSLIPRYAPEWTDHNFSDPGITVLDLLAWLAEMQHYFLDQVTERTLQKFLDLLGVKPQPSSAAEVAVTFEVDGTTIGSASVEPGTRLIARDPTTSERIPFETTTPEFAVHAVELASVRTSTATGLVEQIAFAAPDGIHFYPFGERAVPGDRCYIGVADPHGALAQAVPDRFAFTLCPYDSDLPAVEPPGPGYVWPVELDWEVWTGSRWKAVVVEDETLALSRGGAVTLESIEDWRSGRPAEVQATADLFWVRATIRSGAYDIVPRLDAVLLNTCRARHAKTIRNEVHSSTGLPLQVVELVHAGVLEETVRVTVDGEEWTVVGDLDESGPLDPHLWVDWARGELRFGDGVHGRLPARGFENIELIEYVVGGGPAGNVRPGLLSAFDGVGIDGVTVANRFASSGGSSAESRADALDRARRERKAVTRAITSDDVDWLAMRTPGVRLRRTHVLASFHPRYCHVRMPGCLTVVVLPYRHGPGLAVPTANLLENVRRHLAESVPVTTDVHVVSPWFVRIDVDVRVVGEPRTHRATLATRIELALQTYLDPIEGGDEGNGWEFGRAVHYSDLVAIVGRVAGVESVVELSFHTDQLESGGRRIDLPKTGLAYAGEIRITVDASEAT